ncbi:hypothetical protein EIN_026630 [Entamoeba invadens IP1]|uniref:hypothetical protein n=1 Tax=Entamoeba invadens IP1 TaxID=370355 RepID=UPI0002C3E38C|nr:hypothetical protein EIN_026630 [Entamoeba invadens IP1]ELP90794.1 hypothetical protein EIN_026630 [Entamoeba invadens IP1]|eukprot:XP_004257565.1 hypothetical protein EIN_026630 [Entamoeba invadens IP1]
MNKNKDAEVEWLIEHLLHLMKEKKIGKTFIENFSMPTIYSKKRLLLRRITDTMKPYKYSPQFIDRLNNLLQTEREDPILLTQIPPTQLHTMFSKNIHLFQGDITTLKVDAIVNAANSTLLGCFIPNHSCIDSIIHAKAGVQMRYECSTLPTAGKAKVGSAVSTKGYNLPAKYVIHTVGPAVGVLHPHHFYELQQCYLNSLHLAFSLGCESIAFCCISTGFFGFPNEEAAMVAIQSINSFFKIHKNITLSVVFVTFSKLDHSLYQTDLEMGFDELKIPTKSEYDAEMKEIAKIKSTAKKSDDEVEESGTNTHLSDDGAEKKQNEHKEVKLKTPKVRSQSLDKWFVKKS